MRHLTTVLKDCKDRRMHGKGNGEVLEVHGRLESRPGLREEPPLHKPNILTYLTTGRCHHELEREECKVCNGYVRRLLKEDMSERWAEAEVLGLPQPIVHAARDRGEDRT